MKTNLSDINDRQHFIDRYVDMHMHTTASDGSYHPWQVIRGAYKKGIKVISVTDHDTVAGVLEANDTAVSLGMEFHTGIEMTTDILLPDYYIGGELVGRPLLTELHILGYDIDTTNEKVLDFCHKTAFLREEYNLRIMEYLEENYGVTKDDIGRQYIKGYLGKPQIAEAFQATGVMESIDEIKAKVFTSKSFLKIKKDRLMAETAIQAINDAGGEAVLAHPGRVKYIGARESQDFFMNMNLILQQLIKYGAKGLECVYLRHTDPEKKRFLDLAKKYDLMPTRGTDFHS